VRRDISLAETCTTFEFRLPRPGRLEAGTERLRVACGTSQLGSPASRWQCSAADDCLLGLESGDRLMIESGTSSRLNVSIESGDSPWSFSRR